MSASALCHRRKQRLQLPARGPCRSAGRQPPRAGRNSFGAGISDVSLLALALRYVRPWLTLSCMLLTISAPAEIYRVVIWNLREAGIPYLVGGTYALEHHAGLVRDTKDLDLFVRRADWSRIAETLAPHGIRCELVFTHWLGKAFDNGHFVDLIFAGGNGLVEVDDDWLAHGVPSVVLEVPVHLAPPEEMIWSKAFVMERERYDGADVAHILRKSGPTLDWVRLLRRFRSHAPVLLVATVAVPVRLSRPSPRRARLGDGRTVAPVAGRGVFAVAVCAEARSSRASNTWSRSSQWGYHDAREMPYRADDAAADSGVDGRDSRRQVTGNRAGRASFRAMATRSAPVRSQDLPGARDPRLVLTLHGQKQPAVTQAFAKWFYLALRDTKAAQRGQKAFAGRDQRRQNRSTGHERPVLGHGDRTEPGERRQDSAERRRVIGVRHVGLRGDDSRRRNACRPSEYITEMSVWRNFAARSASAPKCSAFVDGYRPNAARLWAIEFTPEQVGSRVSKLDAISSGLRELQHDDRAVDDAKPAAAGDRLRGFSEIGIGCVDHAVPSIPELLRRQCERHRLVMGVETQQEGVVDDGFTLRAETRNGIAIEVHHQRLGEPDVPVVV